LHSDEVASFVLSLEPDESFSRAERDQLLEILGEGADVHAPVTASARRRPVKRRSAARAASEKAS
jgi:hypothetical protein